MDEATQPSPRRRRLILGGLALGSTWGLYFALLWSSMLVQREDGLYAGWRTVWSDWVAHFAYANVFAYRPAADWFTSHPLIATRSFDYPPLADAISGLLMRAGWDRIDAFLVPSQLTTLALLVLLYLFYLRYLRGLALAWLATTLFFTNGGLGFLELARELAEEPSLARLLFPPLETTYLPENGIRWINIVSSEILPQRALLLGMPLALGLLLRLDLLRERGFAGVSRLELAGLGLLASGLMVAHIHSFLALVLFCALLFAFDLAHARYWLGFAAAAALPCLLVFVLLYGDAGRGFLAWHPGWLAPNEGLSLPLFLWLNWGSFLPLAGVGLLRFRAWREPLLLGGVLLFVLSFLIRFQPHLWDNTKLLTWAHLMLCIPVARTLAELATRRSLLARLAALLLFAFTTASGFLELGRIVQTERVAVEMWSAEEQALADSFRALSEPGALVLCSDHHHHWVTGLTGRRVLLGYRGWLWSYGIDYGEVERDLRIMLAGGEGAEALMERYGVDFVAIGNSERFGYDAAERYFEGRYERVLEGAGYQVFDRSRPVRAELP